MLPVTLSIAAAYLVGSFPSGYWMVRWRGGADVRLLGSGSSGATNVLRVSGAFAAVPVLLLDIGKGALAVVIGGLLEVPVWALGATAAAAVIGHVWPLWLHFRGGKGVATAAGAFLLLSPMGVAMAAVAFLLVAGVTRIVSLGSVAAAGVLPLALALDGSVDPTLIAWAMLVAGLVVGCHHENLSRLRRGSEARLGKRPDSGDDRDGGEGDSGLGN